VCPGERLPRRPQPRPEGARIHLLPRGEPGPADPSRRRDRVAARDPSGRDGGRGAHPRTALRLAGRARAAAPAAGAGQLDHSRRLPGDAVELRQALIALALGLLPAAAAAQAERFAVVVGNDQGQLPDLPLSYAETDAARVASMLQEVAG